MDRSSQGEEGMGLYKPCGIGFDLALYEPYRCNKLNVGRRSCSFVANKSDHATCHLSYVSQNVTFMDFPHK